MRRESEEEGKEGKVGEEEMEEMKERRNLSLGKGIMRKNLNEGSF